MDKANGLFTVDNLELPKHTKLVKGLQLISEYPDRLYYRGSQRIEIGGEELFPDGFDSKILMSSLSVAPRERFFELGDVLPGDLSVKVRYQDKDHSNAAFGQGYKVSLIILIAEGL
ncbi:hypothetical protein [Aquimarina algiphila]|uniref:hypothetical protein n=1 Tax=Aquimarina algiphila TaxID=2047982 RepID=UPI0024922C6E|nr:hypothetical protein [Aquimarina algiphila]